MESSSIFNGEPSQKSTKGLWEDAFKPFAQLKTGLRICSCSWFVPPSASPIEFVHEAALPEFVDKAKLDEVLHFGFGRSCIRERLDL